LVTQAEEVFEIAGTRITIWVGAAVLDRAG
jgi:hypothetical protein